jgi:hypothetical protein
MTEIFDIFTIMGIGTTIYFVGVALLAGGFASKTHKFDPISVQPLILHKKGILASADQEPKTHSQERYAG